MSGLSTMTRVLLAQTAEVKRARYNPHPPGQPWQGSATAAVLKLMQAHPKRRWRRAQLLKLTGRSESAMDWALLYLRHQGLIDGTCGDYGRQWTYWLRQEGRPA